jgi:hypothetical protein
VATPCLTGAPPRSFRSLCVLESSRSGGTACVRHGLRSPWSEHCVSADLACARRSIRPQARPLWGAMELAWLSSVEAVVSKKKARGGGSESVRCGGGGRAPPPFWANGCQRRWWECYSYSSRSRKVQKKRYHLAVGGESAHCGSVRNACSFFWRNTATAQWRTVLIGRNLPLARSINQNRSRVQTSKKATPSCTPVGEGLLRSVPPSPVQPVRLAGG